jgi:hypothetical protein
MGLRLFSIKAKISFLFSSIKLFRFCNTLIWWSISHLSRKNAQDHFLSNCSQAGLSTTYLLLAQLNHSFILANSPSLATLSLFPNMSLQAMGYMVYGDISFTRLLTAIYEDELIEVPHGREPIIENIQRQKKQFLVNILGPK